MTILSAAFGWVLALAFQVVIVLAFVLALRRSRTPGPLFDKIASWMVFLGLVAVLVLIVTSFNSIALWRIYERVVEAFARNTNLNENLIRALVLVWLIPALWVVSLVKSRDAGKRRLGYCFSAAYLASFYFGMYMATKDQLRSQYYAITPEGYYLSPRAGFDSVYGIPLQPTTADVIRQYRIFQAQGLEKNRLTADNSGFFDPVTGEAMRWVSEPPHASARLYVHPGTDPITGARLRPVDREWVAQYLVGREQAARDSTARIGRRQESARRARIQERRAATQDRYLTSTPEKVAVLIVAAAESGQGTLRADDDLAAALQSALAGSTPSIGALLRPLAYTDGLAGAALSGDWNPLRSLDLPSRCSRIVAVRARSRAFTSPATPTVQSAELVAMYRVSDASGSALAQGNITTTGAAFNPTAARIEACQRLSTELAVKIRSVLGS